MRFTVLLACCFLTSSLAAEVPEASKKWEKEISRMEQANAPDTNKGGLLFVGSSSIRLWKLTDTFPDAKILNHGFGGSQIADSVAYLDRIVIPYEPKIIALYAGDNDLAQGKKPKELLEDFRAFHTKIFARLPNTKIIFLPIKPSPKRWSLYPLQQEANHLIKTEIANDARMTYLDLVTPMLNAHGQPREELFVADKLHMNTQGYQVWSIYLRPHLHLPAPPSP